MITIRNLARSAASLPIVLGSSVLWAQVGGGGRIQGTVLTEDRQAVKGAFVIAAPRSSPGVRRTSPPSGTDGSFILENLPGGVYGLCAQVPGDELLDPCPWSGISPTVTVTAGQTVAAVELRLRKGAALRVQVHDPGRHLNTHEGKTAGAHLLVGVFSSDGLFHAAPLLTKGNTRRVYGLVVPHDTSLKLSIYSALFRLRDEQGAALAITGASVAFQAPSNGPPLREFQFTVTGVEFR